MSATTDPDDFHAAFPPERIKAAFLEAKQDNRESLYSHPLIQNWLEAAADVTNGLSQADIENLILPIRRSLAAPWMVCWQSILNLSMEEVTTQNFVEKIRIVCTDEPRCTALIVSLEILAMMQDSLGRSKAYNSLIEDGALAVAATFQTAADYCTQQQSGFDPNRLGKIFVKAIEAKWIIAAPKLMRKSRPFRIITRPAELPADFCLKFENGTYGLYIGPDANHKPHWSMCDARNLAWLIPHEYLHSLQDLLCDNYRNQSVTGKLADDAENIGIDKIYGLPMILSDDRIFDVIKDTHPALRATAHHSLYLSLPTESAAFTFHRRIISLLPDGKPPVPLLLKSTSLRRPNAQSAAVPR